MSDEHSPDDPYLRFAGYYDLEYATHTADLDFYREFAYQAGGPILELGCGSGRVLTALVETGLELTGLDNSPAMLTLARESLDSDVRLVECSMDAVAECAELRPDHYWMAYSAINTFLHLPDTTAQLRALEGLRRVVVQGGLLLLDLMTPDPHYLAGLDGRVVHELSATLPDGNRLDKWAVRTHDFATQTIDTTVFFDTTDATGTVSRVSGRYLTRYIHVFELEHLLERAGWRLISLYGSYDLSPFSSDSERMIALATWGSIETE
ncbi:MAG TPA: class I SAM-dependent methyltransferase [Thermomicrobiales bacterium]|nr:class I SAM-dependent methyltransferase [Thermomicrobiales bacterium]